MIRGIFSLMKGEEIFWKEAAKLEKEGRHD